MQKLLPWRVWNSPRRSADVRRGAGAMGGARINCSCRVQLGGDQHLIKCGPDQILRGEGVRAGRALLQLFVWKIVKQADCKIIII